MRQPRSAASALAATFALIATLALASTGQAHAG